MDSSTKNINVFIIICICIIVVIVLMSSTRTDSTSKVKVVEPIDVNILEMSPGVQEQFRQLEGRVLMLEQMIDGFMRSQGGQQ